VLCQLGLQLASWTRRGFDTRQSDSDIVLRKLLANLKAGDILLLHDRHCAHTVNGVPMIIAVLPQLLEAVKLNKLHPVTLRAALL
jgi:peptidoglycan/xylan/chitin deacetylase (PgdA/CDA1 family)